MSELDGYEGVAWNPASASENRIHADDVARQYGFRGGLVPGVTVYAFLVEPALRVWGLDWLSRGSATVTLRKPLYEGERFRVEVGRDGDEVDGLRCAVWGPGKVLCADGVVRKPSSLDDDVPVRRGDALAPARGERPDATRLVLEDLRGKGLGAIAVSWDGGGELGRYREKAADMPELVRVDGGGFANPSFSLGLANWVLSRNVLLGPWIHVESRVRHHAPVPLRTTTITEARITDLFARGGHEFVDLDVAVFGDDDRPILSAFHRAIYKLREPD